MEMKHELLGRRFVCNGYFGTVCYVGTLPGTEDSWLGVEWDDKTRGKHDGTYQGQRYFSTRFPTSGSFVRPDKIDLGISYSQAVSERYGHKTVNDTRDDTRIIISSQITKPIEMLGMDKIGSKQSQYHQLTTICLKDMKVNGIDKNDDLSTFTPNVVDLDLSKNLLRSWNNVADIIQFLGKLTILDVSENRFNLDDVDPHIKKYFKNLQEIRMASMACTWSEINICGNTVPNVQKLMIPFNEISIIETITNNIFEHLEFLELDSNPLASWEEVLKLAHLPTLEVLHVNDCGIKYISIPDCLPEKKSKLFPKLTTLRISDNLCEKWADVTELNKLQNLCELRMIKNPICEEYSYETTRQIFIAKIGQLKVLNRVNVTDTERKGAELDYLKKYGQLWLNVNKENSEEQRLEFLKEHPRYLELICKFGEAEESELKAPQTNLKSKMITLEISSPLCEKKFKKKIPSTMTVQKFKRLLQQLYKINHQDFLISYLPTKKNLKRTEHVLDNELQELSFYAIEDGDEIHVSW